jgi:hypothetical protein
MLHPIHRFPPFYFLLSDFPFSAHATAMTRYSPLSTDAPPSPTSSSSPSADSTGTASDLPLSQKLVKVIGNVCFSFFVLAVLVVTVVAVTYQPPDPWLTSSAALTTSLSETLHSPTFHLDDSVLPTGEDLVPLNSSLIPVNSISPSVASVPDLVDSPSTTSEEAGESCNPDKPVNCSDPRVLNAVKAFNLKAFTRRSIIFLSYDTPVPGTKPGECDVAWRFRNSKDKSWRRYALEKS